MSEDKHGQEKHEPRVLLVDDDESIRVAYAKALRRFGFVVETAHDGHEAAECVSGSTYDVIVTDLSMPNMTGLEFLRSVRLHDADVPVVIITGEPNLDSAIEAVEYGAFRYLKKPVDLEQLGTTLRKAVGMHQLAKLRREALQVVRAEGKLVERESLEERFSNALDTFWMAYQPVVRWPANAVFGYEALLRSGEPSLPTPVDVLDAAERLGRVHELGRRIRDRVAHAAATTGPPDALLLVNLHPLDLNDPELYSPTSGLAAIAPRVILEITERSSLAAVPGLLGKVHKLRHLGFRIAVDDLGAGYAGLASFSQLEPAIVKLDISLVRGVDASTRKQSVVRAMIKLCTQELAIQVICEGVEHVQERDVLTKLGCELMQGYLFAKPERGFALPR